MRRLVIGADHGGVRLKDQIVEMLTAAGTYEITDVGTHGNAAVDYPNIGETVGRKVASDHTLSGILICGSGIGISIAANKVRGVRAALCHDAYTARMSREHNNANIICLGERVTGSEVAKDAVNVFLMTQFEGGRHETRVGIIADIEGRNS